MRTGGCCRQSRATSTSTTCSSWWTWSLTLTGVLLGRFEHLDLAPRLGQCRLERGTDLARPPSAGLNRSKSSVGRVIKPWATNAPAPAKVKPCLAIARRAISATLAWNPRRPGSGNSLVTARAAHGGRAGPGKFWMASLPGIAYVRRQVQLRPEGQQRVLVQPVGQVTSVPASISTVR
jgi:hypothetical protein